MALSALTWNTYPLGVGKLVTVLVPEPQAHTGLADRSSRNEQAIEAPRNPFFILLCLKSASACLENIQAAVGPFTEMRIRIGTDGRKPQIPSSKLQINFKLQTPNSKSWGI